VTQTAMGTPGDYDVTVTGTGSPSGMARSALVRLSLFDAVPGAVVPIGPTDGATGAS
jgi:hypothetical protein